MSDIHENLEYVRNEIADAAEQSGRSPDAVRLVAVSKTVSIDKVREAAEYGQKTFGENRADEFAEKYDALSGQNYEWHFIGHLQRNKVRQVVTRAHWVHSVDREALADRMQRLASEEDVHPQILMQVNVSGEDSKFGVIPDDAPRLQEKILDCSNLSCRGLMMMAPPEASDDDLRRLFAATRQLRDELASEFALRLPELSMGMTSDFRLAIAEGATIVRIGSEVFGERRR